MLIMKYKLIDFEKTNSVTLRSRTKVALMWPTHNFGKQWFI